MQWNSTSYLDIILYGISCFLFVPFHLLLYIFTFCGFTSGKTDADTNPWKTFVYELGLHFTYPVNRFVGEFKSFVLFLVLIFIASYYDLESRHHLVSCDNLDLEGEDEMDDKIRGKITVLEMDDNKVPRAEFPINWADIPTLIMAIGFMSRSLWTILASIKDRWVSNKRYDMSVKFWTYTHFIASSFVALSVLIKVCANPHFEGRTCDLEDHHKMHHDKLLQCIFCFLGLGTFMIIVRILFFFSLHRRLGPISLIIKRVAQVCQTS